METSETDGGDRENWFNGRTPPKPKIRRKLFRRQGSASMIRKGANCVEKRSCDLGLSKIMKIELHAQTEKGKNGHEKIRNPL